MKPFPDTDAVWLLLLNRKLLSYNQYGAKENFCLWVMGAHTSLLVLLWFKEMTEIYQAVLVSLVKFHHCWEASLRF
jgi:hypothetical protein